MIRLILFLLLVPHASANYVGAEDNVVNISNISVYQPPLHISNLLISHAPISQSVPYVPADKDTSPYFQFGLVGIALLAISFGAGSRLFHRK
jgi:hypothetical protein